MKQFDRLDTKFDVMTGAKPYQTGKGVPKQSKDIVKSKPYTSKIKIDETWVPYMRGRNIDRFTNMWGMNKEYIKYGEWLAEPRNPDVFKGKKLFVRQTGDSLIATYDEGNVSNNTLHSIYPLEDNESMSLHYLLGIINSKLMNWYYRIENYLEIGKPMAEVKGIYIKKLPIAHTSQEKTAIIEHNTLELLNLCQARHNKREMFVNYISKIYEPKVISEKIEKFDKIPFKVFLAELKKQKVKLTASQSMDLLSLYESTKEEIEKLSMKICELIKILDETVFEIYKIPNDIAEMIMNY